MGDNFLLITAYLLKILGPFAHVFYDHFWEFSIFLERPPPCFFLINSNIFSFHSFNPPPLLIT